MKYIKYFEGFTYNQLNNLILNDKTYINKMDRDYNNKEMKYSKEIIDYDNHKLKSILEKIEKFDLIYDDELNNKIKELYE